MKKLFRLSSISKPNPNRYSAPPGPPPGQANVPGGPAADYYGNPPGYPQQQQQGQYPAQNQYSPPSGPPPMNNNHQQTYHNGEDPMAMLARYDTVILVDDSGSMEMFWDQTRDALIGVVQKAIQYDSDGIDIHFFNDTNNSLRNCTSVQQVQDLFRRVEPRRSTPTASSIKRVLDPYLTQLHYSKTGAAPPVKPLNLVVLTDGAPDKGQEPEQVIVEIGRYLDSSRYPLNQLGISFIQIGDDMQAARHLASLDDDLKRKHQIRDFVDCTPYQASGTSNVITSDFILKALLGGINRKIDNQRRS
ncbi:hypothetical protein PPACK8108_LOCUS5069 [Phakopsora pachyrhizi]|uniref:VWFA domain-containing protein n=1 Tax=Phakopsora pachyrhizi TaxID=170000 RepID=A0AAV0ANJ6_PHAPC|nr:hypothetical protein PPACK8108_LOCUS5069 [Phakopsora pachyrhizi]